MIDYKSFGITYKSNQTKLHKLYKEDIQRFREAINDNPYRVLIDQSGMSWRMADELAIKRYCKPDAYCRCQYAAYQVLKANEQHGNTRMTDSELAREVHNLAPEAVKHIVTVVSDDPRVWYDAARHLVGFEHTHLAEQNIAEHIKQRLKAKRDERINRADHESLTDEQFGAVELAINCDVSMLNGYAGSGKSFTTKAIINELEERGLTYQLLAPTGIAAKVLRGYTGRQAMTIHLFLTSPWKPDYIIIDESSMVSVHLLSALLDAVGNKPRLVFVADNAQLASIQCGSIVQDIIDSGVVPRTQLTKIFRYNSSGIVTIATDMRQGHCEHLTDDFPDYLFEQENNSEPIQQVVRHYEALLAQCYTVDDIMVLCPFNKHIGADAINVAISDMVNSNEPVRKNSTIKIGDKVINIKNDYSAGVDNFIANGDIGYLREYQPVRGDDDIVLVDFDNGEHNVGSLTRLKQAYALSVHKSQGSSAKVVIVLIDPSHGFFLTRNLMYVAVTRAREKLIVIGDEETIAEGIKREEQIERNTGLKEMLDKHTII